MPNGTQTPDLWSRAILRRALKASLATLHHETGYPYASLVTIATLPDGAPLMLISTLAEHTKNIVENPRASLLFDETGGLGDPLEGARVSVFGRIEKVDGASARARFLSRHPAAANYADFDDFAFYALNIEGAHFVGGFGLILDLGADDLTTDVSDAARLIEAEAEIVEHMNATHAGAVALYATKLLGAPAGDWRFVSCDPEGCDLVLGETGLRLDFPDRVTTPQAVRKTLAELAQTARR
ncbi:MAG: HugZ family protein [Methyloligellaceae bacterium]